MIDPFIVEFEFQKLKQLLGLITSKRLKLLYILNFIEPLIESSKRNVLAAYLEELFEYFISIDRINFIGTNLPFLFRLQESIEKLCSLYPSFAESIEIKNSLLHLRNEDNKIIKFIQKREEEEIFKISSKTRQKNEFTSTVDSVWIPLVEREPLLAENKAQFATINKLKVNISISNKKGNDELLVSGYVNHVQTGNEGIEIALKAAKNLYKKFTKQDVPKRLLVYCNFDKATNVVGESLEAGLTAVIFCELLRIFQSKEEFYLGYHTAITGKIDETGKLYAVDEEGLKLKIESCNFSFIKYLIIPMEQEELCKKYIQDINSSSGFIPVEIVGISEIEEIFVNRKYTDLNRISFFKQSVRKIWKARRTIAVTIFLALILLIGKMLFGPIDKNPVSGIYTGEYLVLLNKSNEELDRIDIGNNTTRIMPSFPRVSFWDIDEDGYNDVIWSEKPNNLDNTSEIINCKNLIRDSLLWSCSTNHMFSFPNNDPGIGGYQTNQIIIGDFDCNGRVEILTMVLNGQFPGLICKIDASTGKEISCYINMGHLSEMQAVDINNDNIKEIIAIGTSNAFNKTCLIVLDSRFISGHSPLTTNYIIDEVEEGLEEYYLLFPKSIIGQMHKEKARNNGEVLMVDEEKQSIRFCINEGSDPLENPSLYPNLDYSLKIKCISTGDFYDIEYEKLLKEGKIAHIPLKKYLNEKYIKSVQYWNGEKFVNESVQNKNYLKAIK